MKIIMTLLVALLLVVLTVVGFAYSGLYDVRASAPHSGLVSWFLATTSRSSIERGAAGIDVPDLSDEALLLAGVNDFNAMCVGCHGAPGRAPEAMGQGLNPAPPDLSESAQNMSPAQLFWVTKNGTRMTGMPAWGATHEDDALWPVVSFMLKLPELEAAGYEALLASAAGKGHHDSAEQTEHDHGAAGHDETTVPENAVPEGHEDHDHEH